MVTRRPERAIENGFKGEISQSRMRFEIRDARVGRMQMTEEGT